jgi:GNAT superfamily N-acetyltransferase
MIQILVIKEFAIAPSYQSQGYGKILLHHVIDAAQSKNLSVALTAAPGTFVLPPFAFGLHAHLASFDVFLI